MKILDSEKDRIRRWVAIVSAPDTIEPLPNTNSNHLLEKVLTAYREKVLGILRPILSDYQEGQEEALLEALKKALAEIALLLDYTSIPENPTTHLLCDMATVINAAEERAALRDMKEALLKNWEQLSKELLHNSSLLENIKQLIDSPGDDKFHELKNLLTTNAHLIRDQNLKKIIKPLIEYPSSAIQILIPTLVGDVEGSDKADYSLVEILKSHILSSNRLSLIPVQILTALSVDDQRDTDTIPRLANYYYDYEYAAAGMEPYLNEDEYRRLIQHSEVTRNLVDEFNAYQAQEHDQHHLLGHLRTLCDKLYFNSKAGIGDEYHAGSGAYLAISDFQTYYEQLLKDPDNKEKIPPQVVEAIDRLFSVASKEGGLHNSVDAGEHLSADACIASRRDDLVNAISVGDNETILSHITFSEDNKHALIEETKARFANSIKQLNEQLINKSYVGRDPVSISQNMLRTLGVDFTISSEADMLLLERLAPSEIRDLFANEALQEQLISQLRSLEDLVLFCLKMPPVQLKEILPTLISHSIIGTLVKNVNDFAAWLLVLNPERCQIICEATKEQLHKFIRCFFQFKALLAPLSPDRQSILFKVLIDKIPGWLDKEKSLYYLKDVAWVFSCLPTSEQAVFFKLVKDDIVKFCLKEPPPSYDSPISRKLRVGFIDVLVQLNSEQQTILYDALNQNVLFEITGCSNPLDFLCRLYNNNSRAAFFERIKFDLAENIKSVENLNHTCLSLNEEEKIALFPIIQEKIPTFCNSIDSIAIVFKTLNPEQNSIVYHQIKDRLLALTTTIREHNLIYFYLTPTALKEEYSKEVGKNHAAFFNDIQSTEKLALVLQSKTRDKCSQVFSQLKPEDVTIDDRLGICLMKLTPEEGKQLLGTKSFCLTHFILPEGFSKRQNFKVLEQYYARISEFIKNSGHEGCPTIISTSRDFNELLKIIDPRFRTMLYDGFGVEGLVGLIHSITDCEKITEYLNQEQKDLILNNWVENVRSSELVQTKDDFVSVYNLLNPHQQEKFFNTFITSNHFQVLVDAMTSSKDFCEMLQLLGIEQRRLFFNAVKDKLLSSIDHANKFEKIYPLLDPESRSIIISNSALSVSNTQDLATIINIVDDAEVSKVLTIFGGMILKLDDPVLFFRQVNASKMATTIEYIEAKSPNYLSGLLKSIENINHMREEMNLLQVEQWYNKFEKAIVEKIKTAQDLRDLLAYGCRPCLPSNVASKIYHAIEPSIPSLIEFPSDLNRLLVQLPPTEVKDCLDKLESIFFNKLIDSPEALDKLIPYLTPEKMVHVYEKLKHVDNHFSFTENPANFIDKLNQLRISIPGTTTGVVDLFAHTSAASKKQKLNTLILKFELSLLGADKEDIKERFLILAQAANTHRRSSLFLSFGKTRSFTQLLEAISGNKEVTKLLASALDIDIKSKTTEDVKKEFLNYYSSHKDDPPALSSASSSSSA